MITALDATLQTCTGCHETYRQDIVDASALERAAGTAGGAMDPSCPMMHSK